MASQPNQPLATILLALIVAIILPAVRSDDTCPYPCYPAPPAGAGTPATLSPPAYYSPPAAYYPYNPPPYNGGSFDGIAPPPPDPILPYFPYYYKKPPHQLDDESGGITVAGRRSDVAMIAGTLVYVSFSLFLLCLKL